ncbi:MAG: YgfZ/GcvT domain-containing protein [Acidimicrobiaceae bacterium]
MTVFYFEYDRDVLYVSGVDARKFLHSQLANDVASLKVGASKYSLLLEPTGKITSLLRVHCKSEEDFVLDCDAGFGEVSVTRLSRFKIRIKCEISSGAQRFVAVRGLSKNDCVEFLARKSALAAWRESDCAVDFVASEFVAGDLRQGTAEELELARVMAKWPAMGVDMTSNSLPAETGLTDCAVIFTKGCYPGQELVERMDSRGATAPRQLRLIRAEAGASAGAPVVLNGEEIGMYTSVCQEFALALIKRSADSHSIEIGA